MENVDAGILYEMYVGVCIISIWQGAKNIKFPARTRFEKKGMSETFVSLEVLQKSFLDTIATGRLENGKWI